MKIEELQDIPEQQYSLYLKDHKAEGVSYGADMPRDAEYRFQTENNNIPKSQFFGKVRSLTGRDKETTYTTGALRAIPRFAIDASTGLVSGISRIGQEAFVQPALNLYDMYGWYSLDREVEDYKKSVGFYNMTPQEMGNFIKNDAKYLELQQRMNQKSREIATREDPKFAQATNELWQNYRKAIVNFEDAIGVSAKETDSEFINNIGSGAASLLEAAAIVAITKNPTTAAYVFGVQQGTGLYEEAREKGVDVPKAMALATAGGAAEGLLEKWGLHKLAENITTKTLFRAAGKSFLTESIQEGSQQAAEEALMYKIRNDESFKDKAARVVESMAIGGMLGSAGSVVSRPFVLKYAKGIKEELTNYDVSEEEANNLVEKAVYGNEQEREQASHDIQVTIGTARFSQMGFSGEEAQTLAEKFSITNQEFKDEIVESLTAELDPSTYEGGTVEGGVKFFDENINKGVFTEDFDIAEDVKKTAEEGGMNEQQANLVATAVDSFAKVMYNKTGITPRENWENGDLSLMIKDERPSVDELEDVDESTLTKEEAEAVNDGSYIGEDGQLYDKDGKILFQDGIDLSQRINEIDAEEQAKGVPEYTAPTININGVERQTTNSDGNPIAKSEKSLRYFYDWFGDSLVVDSQGRPLVVYHGTNAVFEEFDITKVINGRASGNAFYFTKNKGRARGYGENLLELYVSIKNPFTIDDNPLEKSVYVKYAKDFLGFNDEKAEKSYIDNNGQLKRVHFFNLLTKEHPERSSEFLQSLGYDGVFSPYNVFDLVLAFNPNQIKSTSNRGTWSKESDKIYWQKGEDTKDLVVYHNISKESLEKAMKLGGLPVPSLAITRKDIPFGRFGEISLVGNKEMIDPSNYKNEVYNRDVWSATFPQTEYRKPKDSAIKKFKNKFGKFFEKAGDTNDLSSFVYSLTFSPARAENEIANSLGMKLAYIETELGKEVEIPKKDFGESILKENKIDKQFVEDLKDVDINGESEYIKKAVTEAYRKMLDRKDYSEFGKYAERVKNMEKTSDKTFDENGIMYFGKADSLLYAAKKYEQGKDKSVIDDTALRQKIDDMIKDKQAYREWSRATLEYELLGEPKIEVGRSLKEMTLQNIVDAMTLGETKNAQDSFVYGTGKVIAAGAKKLESIADIKLESGKIVSEEEEKAIHEKLTEDITSFSSRILKASNIPFDFNAMSAALAALGHIATLKNPTVDSLQKALNKEMGEKRVYPRYILEEGVRIAEEVKGLVRNYFEAKPQRAVILNEFSGAIVPTDSKYDDISKKLQEQGLKVVRSDNQLDAVKEFEDVFFQDETSPRGFYKHSLNQKILEILKSGDASTVIHELGHYFTINYLEALQKTGQQEEAREILDWLGIASVDELLGDTQTATNALERLARGFETYVMTNEAPTSRLREFFERFKNWLLDIYKAIAPEQINDNVRNFFDKMLSAEEVDVSEVMRLAESKQDVREVIKQALSGKAVEIGGIKIDDIKTLVKTANARIPKKVKTLLERLKDVGINENFAREFDLQNLFGIGDLIADDEKLKELKKQGLITQKQINDARKLIRKVGGIEKEDELIDFLHGLGLIRGSGETYEDTSALWDEAMNILENAESTYAMDDIEKAEARQAVMDAISQAEDMLAGVDYNSVIKALKTLAKEDTVGVKKETLKYIKDKQKEIEKGYMKLLKQMLKAQKKDMQDVRDAVVDYIKEQPILAEDKAKLMGFIKKANSLNTLQKLSEQIRNKAMEYYDKEQRKELNRAIQKELKQTKPYSGGEQRYDYENNKLFKDLRAYNKLTREKAGEELAKLPMDEASVEDLTETDLIKRRFLSYKANGADASAELLNQVLKDIVDAKAKGKQAKTDEEYEKAINMENDRQELIQILDESKADPKSVSQIIQNKYRTWITNLYSLLNSIFGKRVADKYQLETKQTDVNARVWKKTTDVINGIARILGVKGRAGVIDAFSDMAQRKYTITDVEGLNKEIDIFGVIDIYNAIKNEKTKQDYYKAFGELQVNSLVNTLTVQERALGDYMMQEVNNYYEKLNDVYVKLYGIDLPRVDNYWPATSEHKDSIDIQGDYFQQTTVPSALKERSRGRVIPIPTNAWQKFNKHIAEAEYISGLGLDYMNIKKIFKSRRIKSKIIEKYGEPVYKAIMSDIESLSMASKIQEIDEVNNTFQKILGNTVLAKIAIGIPVFMKQLTSITNYAVDMPVKLWAKGFAEGLSHPKETVKYMMDNAPFLKARFGQGYNEALARVIRDASKMSGKKVRWAEAMSSFTRYGDIGAIIFGGYPYMKYLKNTGVENASEKFEFATLRSQQSGTPVSLSPFQRSRGMMQIFQAFNNTPMQYMRMIYDAIYQWKNGDITAQQMCKQLFNFGIIQPVLFVLAGIYANKMLSWGDDDDDDNTIAQIVKQIVLNPIDGIPVFSDFIGAIVDRLSGEKNFGMKPVLISDIDKAFSKLNKKEIDAWDAAEIITPIVEGMTAAPMGRVERLLKKNLKD